MHHMGALFSVCKLASSLQYGAANFVPILVALVFSNTSRFVLLIDFSSVPTSTDCNSLLNLIHRIKK